MKQVAVVVTCVFLLAIGAYAQAPDTDIYHVHFAKAVPGQTKALENELKTGDPKAPMPGHFLVLRHRDGDDWDYAVIEHLGKKFTLDPASYSPPPSSAPATGAWHTDTFVVGPSWDVFAKQMGFGADAAKGNPVYILATWRAVPGKRAELSKMLSTGPAPNAKIQPGSVMLAHIEGGPWQFLTLDRFNSWQDYATNQDTEADEGWYTIRDYGAWHHDTLASRVATSASGSAGK